mgnify:FL=1
MNLGNKIIYQIYPKSFQDTNGDGIGDLQGVIRHLDYIKELGADYLWLTPFLLSPQYDNGYDVADYRAIDPRYGTMEDFDQLVEEAGKRGMYLMMDMVFNHCSTEHEWFQKALAGDPYYRDFFIIRKGKDGGLPPTNWVSKFGGSAWGYLPGTDEYYLHLFHVSQADLNWENPCVRQACCDIVRFWMDKGVKGFRFDVINLISKGAFEDDYEGDGRRFYTDGPNIHKYLQELNRETFGTDAEIITVGEMSSTSMENCFRYAGEDSGELSMVFSFHHLKVDFMGNEKWVMVPYDFQKLKDILFSWQKGMAEHRAWNAVFWCNHDQPRVVSRFGDEGTFWKQSAKMLGTVIHCLRGTPYIYQGEELGMLNCDFEDISQYRDVESLNYYRILQEKGMAAKDALRIIQIHSRDNGRTPMQWTGGENAGFTTGTPWIGVSRNSGSINVETELADGDSVFRYYQKLVKLRKDYDVVAYGDFEALAERHPQIFAYRRTWKDEELLVVNNFYGRDASWNSGLDLTGFEKILGNYDGGTWEGGNFELRPFESLVLYRKK